MDGTEELPLCTGDIIWIVLLSRLKRKWRWLPQCLCEDRHCVDSNEPRVTNHECAFFSLKVKYMIEKKKRKQKIKPAFLKMDKHWISHLQNQTVHCRKFNMGGGETMWLSDNFSCCHPRFLACRCTCFSFAKEKVCAAGNRTARAQFIINSLITPLT